MGDEFIVNTGYFGYIEEKNAVGSRVNRQRLTKVHAVHDNNLEPICGARIGPKMIWHWCGHGVVDRYITCERCKRKLWPFRYKSPVPLR
jgi:hypothetical protein